MFCYIPSSPHAYASRSGERENTYIGELKMRERKTRIEFELELRLNIRWERPNTHARGLGFYVILKLLFCSFLFSFITILWGFNVFLEYLRSLSCQINAIGCIYYVLMFFSYFILKNTVVNMLEDKGLSFFLEL